MQITYLTIEDIESGLFQTQVLNVLTEIANQAPEIRFDVLIINRPWLLFSHLRKKKQLEKSLHKSIKLRYIPLLPPLRDALSSFIYSALVTEWLRLIYWLTIRKQSSVLHCRSYWPAQAALKSTRKPVLFDMRSLWLLENISMNLLKVDSASYNYWTKLENNCLRKSCVSTGVSKGMIDYSKIIAPESHIELVPISVDLDKFKYSEKDRGERRKQLSWSDKTILVYSGSFGQSNINLSALQILFGSLINSNPNFRLLFLTMEKEKSVDELMEMSGVDKARYKLIHPRFDDMGEWLSAGDIGLHALPKQLDYKTRLGTKVVEYWANGLPVIVNEYVGAAADLIEEHQMGAILYEDRDMGDLSELVQSLLKTDRDNQVEFAKNVFSTKVVAKQYIEAYRVCAGSLA